MITQASDFKGVYKISTDNFSQLDNYIAQFEPKYLKAILGDDNYTAIEAHSNFEKYVDLLDKGLKEALLGFIYFHYVSDNFVNTVVGNTYNNNENSTNVQNNAQICINRFNTASIRVNTDVYDHVHDYIDLETPCTGESYAGGVYTLLLDTTEYLDIGLNVQSVYWINLHFPTLVFTEIGINYAIIIEY